MTDKSESKPREFLHRKMKTPIIQSDYYTLEVTPESETDPSELLAEKAFGQFRTVDKCAYESLQSQLSAAQAEIERLGLKLSIEKDWYSSVSKQCDAHQNTAIDLSKRWVNVVTEAENLRDERDSLKAEVEKLKTIVDFYNADERIKYVCRLYAELGPEDRIKIDNLMNALKECKR